MIGPCGHATVKNKGGTRIPRSSSRVNGLSVFFCALLLRGSTASAVLPHWKSGLTCGLWEIVRVWTWPCQEIQVLAVCGGEAKCYIGQRFAGSTGELYWEREMEVQQRCLQFCSSSSFWSAEPWPSVTRLPLWAGAGPWWVPNPELHAYESYTFIFLLFLFFHAFLELGGVSETGLIGIGWCVPPLQTIPWP